jgi:alkylation response protein AidB-like acyl-CoA dehydrogenase
VIVDFAFTATDEAFRAQIRGWLVEHLVGRFAEIEAGFDLGADWETRLEWERLLGRDGWIGLEWPATYGGREASITQQLIFHEEYARAGAPGRAGFFGESLLGPTLIASGSEAHKQRFLPPILRGEEYWCQGFSEPDAGSDLAGVRTRAVLDGDSWVITGQKVWTSQAQFADWCFVLCRTGDESQRHRSLSLLLCPMRQPGISVKPIRQLTGTSEFNEVFFDGARTDADLVVGGEGNGWRVAMGTLGFERGTAFLGQQLRFAAEYARLLDAARQVGADGLMRQRLAAAYIGLQLMRFNGFRVITAFLQGRSPGAEGSIGKLLWSRWHQRLGELEMDVLGAGSQVISGGGYELDEFQQSFLFSRSHTIYAGSSEIQRNILGERLLGLHREPKAAQRVGG